MSKYESLEFLKRTTARIQHRCCKYGQNIEKGQNYCKESVGKVNAPGLVWKEFCLECVNECGDKLLIRAF